MITLLNSKLTPPRASDTTERKRLHPLLDEIPRKTLEPETVGSSYLLRDGESYRLDLGEEGWVDVDDFKEHVRRARVEEDPQKALESCLKAVALYTGDYLEEDLYADWCAEERDALKEEYFSVLRMIMSRYEDQADYRKCIAYARKYLAADKYDEGIYRDLMRYYALTGNTRMVAKAYAQCKEQILEGLDCPLSPETEALYQRLMTSKIPSPVSCQVPWRREPQRTIKTRW